MLNISKIARLFSFQGRTTRSTFRAVMIALLATTLILWMTPLVRVIMLVWPLLLWLYAATCARRLHDVDKSAWLRPATHDEIKATIGSRFPTYPQPKRTEGEAAAFWADYFDALEGLTPAMVEAGMAAHVKDPKSEFLPKPGRLAELARTTPTTGRFTRAYNRARCAVLASQKAAEPKSVIEDRPSPEEVKAMVAKTLAALAETPTAKAAAARKKALRPTPSAPLPAGSAMSAEMRAMLEARKVIPPIDREPYQYGEAA